MDTLACKPYISSSKKSQKLIIIQFAAAKGHYDMCDDLISHGADVNAVGYIGM